MSTMIVSNPDEQVRKVEWDPADEVSVAQAKSEFDRLIATNFAYTDTPVGKEQIKEFDPQAETIHVAARLVGG